MPARFLSKTDVCALGARGSTRGGCCPGLLHPTSVLCSQLGLISGGKSPFLPQVRVTHAAPGPEENASSRSVSVWWRLLCAQQRRKKPALSLPPFIPWPLYILSHLRWRVWPLVVIISIWYDVIPPHISHLKIFIYLFIFNFSSCHMLYFQGDVVSTTPEMYLRIWFV